MKLHTDRETIAGYTDDLAAMEQAVFLILSINRYENIIYSWNYGVELRPLFGMPVSWCIPEAQERIREALLQDDRITNVDNFHFEKPERGVLFTSFTVHTIFGDIEASKEIKIA